MIAKCFNPDCSKELRYLRGGRVVRVIRKAGGVPVIEHFWLCEDCHRSREFSFLPDGRVLCRGKQKHAIHGVEAHAPMAPAPNLRNVCALVERKRRAEGGLIELADCRREAP